MVSSVSGGEGVSVWALTFKVYGPVVRLESVPRPALVGSYWVFGRPETPM